MIRSAYFLIAICVSFFFASCASKSECTPDHSDGAWKNVGAEPPAIGQIKTQLVGKDEGSANAMLRGGVAFGKEKDGSLERTWVFEKRADSSWRDCINPDRADISQSFLIVRAVLSGGVVTECSVQNRMLVSRDPVSIKEMLASPKSPLDGDPESCKKAK